MGGAGFGQGLVQGMQQAQDRQLQMQQLKLQQDLAKYQQKHMETQDAMTQINLQSLQKKMQDESTLRNMQSDVSSSLSQPLNTIAAQGPSPEVEPPDLHSQVASLMMAAQHAGEDPMQMLQMLSLQHPRLKEIYDSLQPEKFINLGENDTLISSRTKQPVATGKAKPIKPPEFSQAYQDAVAIDSQNRYGRQMEPAEYIAHDPIQAEKLRQQVRVDEPATVAGAKTAANIQEQGKQLLTPTEANELGMPFGTTKSEATGTMPITAQQRASLAAYDTTRAIMADIEQYSKKVNTASGGLKGKAEQGAKLWGAWTQSDPDAALLQSKAGELATVARSLGEKGALADKDVARAAALVPSVLDTKEVAQQKLHDMRALIDQGEAAFRKSLGIDARAPVSSKKASAVKPPVQDPLAAIPVPPGLTPAQEDAWRQRYAKKRQELQQKMKPNGTTQR